MKLEKKRLILSDLKVFDQASDPAVSQYGEFTAYVAVFGNKDRQGEIIVKGAFADTLPEFKDSGFIAIGHDASGLGVASIKDAREDDYGLLVHGEFYGTQQSQDVRTVMTQRAARGKSVQFSIGYQVLADTKSSGARYLNKIKLWEASYVTIAANPLTYLTGTKAYTPDQDLEDLLAEEDEELTFFKNLFSGIEFAKHTELVLAANELFVNRADALFTKRAAERKSGQAISKTNRTRLTAVRDGLLAEADKLNAILTLGQDAAEEKEEAPEPATEAAANPDLKLEVAAPPADNLTPVTEAGKGDQADETKDDTADDQKNDVLADMKEEYEKWLREMARANGAIV